ncbi:unnamed protein product [Clonostachys rosea]|uniref:Uncharacterized protein n=1 Tax=Bionectria ochroleuca TaxID=29856 RepID=A0ABY6U8G7_BIOOC|nr:unnamed protein product [Clonostachys rosea]
MQEPRFTPLSTTLGLGLAGYPVTLDRDFLRRHYLGSLAGPPLAKNTTWSSTTKEPSTLGATVEPPGIDRHDFGDSQAPMKAVSSPGEIGSKSDGAKSVLPQQNSARLSRIECLERARQLRTEVLDAYRERNEDGTMSVQVENAQWSLSICHMRCGEFTAARALVALVVQTRTDRLGKGAKKTMDAETQLEYLDMLLADPMKGSSQPVSDQDSDRDRESNSGDVDDDDEIIIPERYPWTKRRLPKYR